MKEKLSYFHVTLLFFMTQSGMVIFTLPRLLAQHFGTNGWLALVFIFTIVSINIYFIHVVHRLGKGRSIFEIMEQSIPKFILFPFYLSIVFIWTMIGCLLAKQYVMVFQMIAFPTTNPMIFKLVFDVLAFLLVIQGIYNISKASTVFFWGTMWILLLLFYFYVDFQWSRLTPFFFQDSKITMQGTASIYLAFLGYELCLLLFPYTTQKTRLMKGVWIGNLLLFLNYLYVSFISFGFYGHRYLKDLEFPLLNILAYMQFPFIQGTENLFYAFFMFSIIVTSVMFWWAAKEAISRIFSISQKLLMLVILALSYCISYIFDVMSEIQQWLTILGYIEVVIAFGLPLGLILLLLAQRTRGETTSD
ncbi:GerAB/ArcD/ProY family transporter [Paenibacillus puerhi]|uniref:GerAB/ArcD/ProY family transporter n=1 Tax=Paenibacillus puerhi TaxID=2692622 RepID=UPI001359E3C2|nr:GerAB/ArcD/ProY family transporter [Paenibacillus puerhi]